MGWTIIMEDEDGNTLKMLPKELVIPDEELFVKKPFRLLKYVDPYGNTTFNAFMFEDLIKDLTELKKYLPAEKKQIDEVIKYAKECNDEVHTYLKFCGD